MYEASVKERPVLVVVEELNLRPDDYTLALLTSSEVNEARANELISEYSIDWPLERIALVGSDWVMTLAVGEMMMDDAPPKAVILDERRSSWPRHTQPTPLLNSSTACCRQSLNNFSTDGAVAVSGP